MIRHSRFLFLTVMFGFATVSLNAGESPQELPSKGDFLPPDLYPPADKLLVSPGNTTYTVDPAKGEDMRKINKLKLAPGDRVLIAPGLHEETLFPNATGTQQNPVVIQFLPGRHEFRARQAARLSYFVSNSADEPQKPRPIGIVVKNNRHLKITGDSGSELWFADRMTYFINDHSGHVEFSGLSFDMARPTVSEFRVLESTTNSATLQMAEGSTYSITNGQFTWTGDLGSGSLMTQEAELNSGRCWRRGQWNPFSAAAAEGLSNGVVRLNFKSANPGLTAGHQFQFRNVTRDNTSAVNTRCGDIVFRDCHFYTLPGMGIVSQFSENLTFERVQVAPRPGSGRTSPAWADCFHFSGCRGKILVDSCNFSGMQDDAINVHGTHLRIIEKTGTNQALVRFMHPQTYGFAAFAPGDHIEWVNHATLRAYASNQVTAVERKSDKDWLLTLAQPVGEFGKDDVVDNVSWYPDITIRHCTVSMDSCRGFLITTRGQALVEDCTFTRTAMSAILVEDDAEGWFESGPIRGLTLRNNLFIECADPVTCLNPQNKNTDPALTVHENIRIEGNRFVGGGISAKSVRGLTIIDNQFSSAQLPLSATGCTNVATAGNILNAQDETPASTAP